MANSLPILPTEMISNILQHTGLVRPWDDAPINGLHLSSILDRCSFPEKVRKISPRAEVRYFYARERPADLHEGNASGFHEQRKHLENIQSIPQWREEALRIAYRENKFLLVGPPDTIRLRLAALDEPSLLAVRNLHIVPGSLPKHLDSCENGILLREWHKLFAYMSTHLHKHCKLRLHMPDTIDATAGAKQPTDASDVAVDFVSPALHNLNTLLDLFESKYGLDIVRRTSVLATTAMPCTWATVKVVRGPPVELCERDFVIVYKDFRAKRGVTFARRDWRNRRDPCATLTTRVSWKGYMLLQSSVKLWTADAAVYVLDKLDPMWRCSPGDLSPTPPCLLGKRKRDADDE